RTKISVENSCAIIPFQLVLIPSREPLELANEHCPIGQKFLGFDALVVAIKGKSCRREHVGPLREVPKNVGDFVARGCKKLLSRYANSPGIGNGGTNRLQQGFA